MVPTGRLARSGNRNPRLGPGRRRVVFRSLHDERQGRYIVGGFDHRLGRRPGRRHLHDLSIGSGGRQRGARDAQQSRPDRIHHRHLRLGQPGSDCWDRHERHGIRPDGDVVLSGRDSERGANDDGHATDWVVSAVRVLPTPNCGAASGNCYRIGAGGTWATGANWSNTSGGAACGCTPVATNNAIFNATPTGTTTLAAATTIAVIDMTNFTGTLDTTASNWGLTVNGPFAIQGTLLARNSTIVVTGDVVMLTAGTIVNLGASAWTINGLWTNLSTSASSVPGASTVTIRDAASGTLTFAALAGGTNEFNNLTLDATVTTSITYTMAANPLRIGATLTIRNSTGGATGPTILTTSASNLGITTGALALTTFGSLTANGSAVVVNGNVNVSAANGYVVMGSSTWTVTGTWTNASTSASWSAGTGTVTFTSATGG